jgi:hypothetical protein
LPIIAIIDVFQLLPNIATIANYCNYCKYSRIRQVELEVVCGGKWGQQQFCTVTMGTGKGYSTYSNVDALQF